MEDPNQIHGSTQTNEFFNPNDIKDDIANKIGIKDFFPKNKKILMQKNNKNHLEPLEILNKYRKKVFGISDYQKKLTFKIKKQQKKIKQESENSNWALEVKKFSPPKTEKNKNLFNSTHSFFPNFSNSEKKTFITDIKKKDKKLFFNKEKDAAPDGDTVYSSYVLKDFACPNKNEYDINLNHNTFYGLFNKDKKFKEKKIKNHAEIEKEKKILNKIERRIQTEFLQKISFPPNEKYMNKTVNNFNFNKGLYKINDLRGSLTSADKIRSLIRNENNAPNSQSPNSKYDNNNIQEFNNLKKISNTPNIIRGKTNENYKRNEYYINNKELFQDLDKFYKSKFKEDTLSEENRENGTKSSELNNINQLQSNNNFNTKSTYNNSSNYNRNFNNDIGTQQSFGLSVLNSKNQPYNTYDYTENIERKYYTFNLNQPSNSHVLRMLKINEKHEKLGLTKRVKLGSNNVLNEKLLREKFKNNLDSMVKRNNSNNVYGNSSSTLNKNKNHLISYSMNNKNNIENDYKFNLSLKKYGEEKTKFIKINKNLFNNEIPNEEKKYMKKEDFDNEENENNKNNSRFGSEKKGDSKIMDKYSLDLDEEKTIIKNNNSSINLNENEKSNSENKNSNNKDNIEKFKKININDSSSVKNLGGETLNIIYENASVIQNKENDENNSIKITDNDGNINTQSNGNNEENTSNDKSGAKNKKHKESENVTSPHVSIDKILSKKTFENFNNIENVIANNDEENNTKRNIVIKGKQPQKNTHSNNNANNKRNSNNKMILFNKQANNLDISGLQIEAKKDKV